MLGDTVPVTADSLALVFTFFGIGVAGGVFCTYFIMRAKIQGGKKGWKGWI